MPSDERKNIRLADQKTPGVKITAEQGQSIIDAVTGLFKPQSAATTPVEFVPSTPAPAPSSAWGWVLPAAGVVVVGGLAIWLVVSLTSKEKK